MGRDDVLAQMTESLDLLGMLEEILESQEVSRGSDPLSKGMRITMRKIREGLTQSCDWIASLDDSVGTVTDEEPFEEGFGEYGEDDDLQGAGALEADIQEALIEESDLGMVEGRAVLESVLHMDEDPAEILPRRQQARGADDKEDKEAVRFDKWSFDKSAMTREEGTGVWSRPSGRGAMPGGESGGSSRQRSDRSGVAAAVERIVD
jgi:hypothetical protein